MQRDRARADLGRVPIWGQVLNLDIEHTRRAIEDLDRPDLKT
jgi:hypothetical protein